MAHNEYSRRDFLKTFAALSSAPLLLGVNTGCGNNSLPQVGAVYGPPPVGSTTVSGIYFIDGQSNHVPLADNQNVPLHTSFLVEFSADINTYNATLDPVRITDSGNNALAHAIVWTDSRRVGITPSADLLPDSPYTLQLTDYIWDTNGDMVDLSNASASFKTTA
jgi:hypothetical protein